MAITINTPDPYSSVQAPVLFKFTRDANTPCVVEVKDIGKILPSSAYQVNVANYFCGDFYIHPTLEVPATLSQRGPDNISRVVDAYITVDGVESATVRLISARRKPQVGHIMSDLKQRTIAPGQVDEISLFLDAPARVVYGDTAIEVGRGVTQVLFKAPDNVPDSFSIYVTDPRGEEMDHIDYKLLEDCQGRLAWINPYGAIDFWNFQTRIKTTLKTTKKRIYTNDGYLQTSLQAERTQTLSTQPLPEAQVDIISGLCTAEQAWLIEGTKAHEIDITTESIVIHEQAKLSVVHVEFRTKQREI